METFIMFFYIIVTIVAWSSAFSIGREDATAPPTSYPDSSVEVSFEDELSTVTDFPCQEPSEADLTNQLQNKILAGENRMNDIIPEKQLLPKWKEITGMGVYVENGHLELTATDELQIHASLNLRTLCPWNETSHTDPERYPRTIYHARCLCNNCTDWSQEHNLSSTGTCKPIPHQINVLRRGECVNGTYSYDFAWEPVTVACVCSRRSD